MSILQTIIHLLFFSVSIYLYSGDYGLLNLNILMWRRNCPLERRKNESPRFFFVLFQKNSLVPPDVILELKIKYGKAT